MPSTTRAQRRPAMLPIALALACALSLPARPALIEIPRYDKELAKADVQVAYSDESLAALLRLVEQQLEDLKARAAAGEAEDRERAEHMAAAVGEALQSLSAIAASSDEAAKAAAFPALKSLLYSVRTDLRGKRKTNIFLAGVGVLRGFSLKLPYVLPEDRTRGLTAAEARLEAVNLSDPRTGRVYTRPEELAGLTYDQVVALDVRPDNYLWYTEEELGRLKAKHGTAWRAHEARFEARVAEALDAPYRLEQARHLLLYHSIRTSGTSPKMNARDVHGQKWTIKWGDEVQSEALATHLYVELGSKFADLVYATEGGQADLVLVLEREKPGGTKDGEKKEKAAEESCDTVATLDRFRSCLLESHYKFDVSAHIVGHGVITEDTLRQEPFSSYAGKPGELVGREFVTFNEALLAFEPKGGDFLRLGAGPMSSGGALDDRAKRGLVVLAYWLHNKDAKDDNNKGVIDRQAATYVEYPHDLGASLGSLRTSANPNLMAVGRKFVARRDDTVRFSSNMLYLPKAFRRATHADAVWMARKLVALPREVILAAVASTAWPDFQQQIMASRLIARRNAIARAYDLGPTMDYAVEPTAISLRTPADRLAVVRRYRVALATEADERKAVAQLEQFMLDCGIPIVEGQADFEDRVAQWMEDPRRRSEERVLETKSCENSVLVAWLERTIHPSGLSRRMHRGSDNRPLRACQPTPKTLGIRGG